MVVVSAMGHTTDDLIALAQQVSVAPPSREMDMLLTAGERISMALLSMALADLRIPAISFTGSQSGILTDESHRRARIRSIQGARVKQALEEGKVAIVAGFQGVSPSKEITTLGRGGSDTTAVALAVTLAAERCEIYTDVDGVFSADPRVVREAHFLPRIPSDLMVEMATLGAGVLHPRSVELAKKFRVPLWVKNSLDDRLLGTEVFARETRAFFGSEPQRKETGLEEFQVTGVSADTEKSWVRVELPRTLGSVQAIWHAAQESHLLVLAPSFHSRELQFFVENESEGEWRKILERLSSQGFIGDYQLDPQWVPLSVVGDRFAQDGRALGELMGILSAQGIDVRSGIASALSMTFAVPASRAKDGVLALHQSLFRKENSGLPDSKPS